MKRASDYNIVKYWSINLGGVAYFLIALLHLFSILTHNTYLQSATKPLLMPILLLIFLFQIRKVKQKINITITFIIGALLFSFLGDVLLMFVDYKSTYFLFGLGAFLIAHLFYIATIRKILLHHSKSIIPHKITMLLIVTYLLALISLLYPYISSDFRFPVIVYGCVISGMLLISFNLKSVFINRDFKLLIAGTILFVLSDSLIAINKFYAQLPQGGFWIMLSYILAQFFIVTALLSYLRTPKQKKHPL